MTSFLKNLQRLPTVYRIKSTGYIPQCRWLLIFTLKHIFCFIFYFHILCRLGFLFVCLFAYNRTQTWTSINKRGALWYNCLLWFMKSMGRNVAGTLWTEGSNALRTPLTPLCIISLLFSLSAEWLIFVSQGGYWLSYWPLFIGSCSKIPRDQNWLAPCGSLILPWGNKLRTVSLGSLYKHRTPVVTFCRKEVLIWHPMGGKRLEGVGEESQLPHALFLGQHL